jgi:HEAT repeat protein
MLSAKDLENLLHQLNSERIADRDAALESLRDLLEYSTLTAAEVQQAISSLIQTAASESDSNLRLSALDAITTAQIRFGLIEAPWQRLAHALEKFDPKSLTSALEVLGFTHDKSFAERVRPYLQSKNAQVRESASDALIELGAN